MPQDAFTLKYLCEELNSLFSGGKINKIVQPDGDRIVFTVYTGKCCEKLLLDVNPASPRIGVIDREVDGPLTAPNFCMLLRKHLLSATIESISLLGFDRIVKIDLIPTAEFFDDPKKVLYVELMGRYSNIILTQEGKILGGNRGINMLGDFVRPLICGKPYVLPPSNSKLPPYDENLVPLFVMDDTSDYAKKLAGLVQGLSVDTAKEILLSYGKNPSDNPQEFFEHLNTFIYNSNVKPCVLTCDGQVKDVFVYPYHGINGDLKVFDKLYKAEDFYHSERERLKSFKTLFDRLNSIINTALKKAKKRLNAIRLKESEALNLEDNRIKGELIMANIYRIKQGDSQIIADNYYDGSKMTITLNPLLPPQKNAENFYKKYAKQKRALQSILPQKEQASSEVEYITSISDYLALAKDITDLKMIRDELKNYGLIKDDGVKKRDTDKTFCRVYDVKGFTVKVGRNNTENDKLTFTARGESTWLHAKDYHSSHVIIEYDGKEVPDPVIVIASEICAYYSKGREGGKVEIVYTLKKNVKKPPKSKPGFVTYASYKSINVNAQEHSEFLKTD
ncbi:MAG: fibronectin/fibrinogen-binding protein [Clostridiales bacterium]|nr:fibronectin/fibrinogen-binding protein [Clostridiales bacterium]